MACGHTDVRKDHPDKSGILVCLGCGAIHQENRLMGQLKLNPTLEQEQHFDQVIAENQRAVKAAIMELEKLWMAHRFSYRFDFKYEDDICGVCKKALRGPTFQNGQKEEEDKADKKKTPKKSKSAKGKKNNKSVDATVQSVNISGDLAYYFYTKKDTSIKTCWRCYYYKEFNRDYEHFANAVYLKVLDSLTDLQVTSKSQLRQPVDQAIVMWERTHDDRSMRERSNNRKGVFLHGCRDRVAGMDLSDMQKEGKQLTQQWLKDNQREGRITSPQGYIFKERMKKKIKLPAKEIGSIRDVQKLITDKTCYIGGVACKWLAERAEGIYCNMSKFFKRMDPPEFKGNTTPLFEDRAHLENDVLTFRRVDPSGKPHPVEELAWYPNDYIKSLQRRSYHTTVYTSLLRKEKGDGMKKEISYYIQYPFRIITLVGAASFFAVPVFGLRKVALVVFDRESKVRYVKFWRVPWMPIHLTRAKAVSHLKKRRNGEPRWRYRIRMRHLKKRTESRTAGKAVNNLLDYVTSSMIGSLCGEDDLVFRRLLEHGGVSLVLPEFPNKLSLAGKTDKDRNRIIGKWPVATLGKKLAYKAKLSGIYPGSNKGFTIKLDSSIRCPECGIEAETGKGQSGVPLRDQIQDESKFICFQCGYTVDYLVALARSSVIRWKPIPAEFVAVVQPPKVKEKGAKKEEKLLPMIHIKPVVVVEEAAKDE